MNTWFNAGQIEAETTKICIDYSLSQQCTTRPFDHDYNNDGIQDNSATSIFWGMTLAKY